MKVIIEIECDNAAFDSWPGGEVKRILNGIIPKLDDCKLEMLDGSKLRDINGNTVGKLIVKD